MGNKNQQLGITLLELLSSMCILASLVGLAIPSFLSLYERIIIDRIVNDLVGAIHLARQTSYATFTDVVVCKTHDGAQCSSLAEWHDGWLVFTNRNNDSPPRVDKDDNVLIVQGPAKGVAISANRDAFILRPGGRRSTNGTLINCGLRGSATGRTITISYSGKPRVSRASSKNRIMCETDA